MHATRDAKIWKHNIILIEEKKGVKEHKSGWTFQGAPCLSWEQEKDVFDAIENRKKS